MPILSLDDDVLFLIVSYLHGSDAINFSLCARHAYAIAISRVVAVGRVVGSARLHEMCKTLLLGPAPRARHIRVLSVRSPALADARGPRGVATHAVWLLRGLLLQARGLRELELSRFEPCLEHDHSIEEAVASLTHLTRLKLSTISNTTLSLIPHWEAARGLQELKLCFPPPHASQPSISFASLVSALPSLPNMRCLELRNVTSLSSQYPSGGTSLHPSVQSLHLIHCCAETLEVVQLFPNLGELSFLLPQISDDMGGLRDDYLGVDSEGPVWTPLHRLTLSSTDAIPCLFYRLSSVDHVQILGTLDLSLLPYHPSGDDEADEIHFAEVWALHALLRVASPVKLSATLGIDRKGLAPMQPDRLQEMCPRLRCLDLHLNMVRLSCPDVSFLKRSWLICSPRVSATSNSVVCTYLSMQYPYLSMRLSSLRLSSHSRRTMKSVPRI
ncbi:hypothetical protein C8Q76DRAFT_141592 [Earliella scabrosa]|nr:hypothetical protein C8Q76DRAFT_141592 [Earliella scabrosa]